MISSLPTLSAIFGVVGTECDVFYCLFSISIIVSISSSVYISSLLSKYNKFSLFLLALPLNFKSNSSSFLVFAADFNYFLYYELLRGSNANLSLQNEELSSSSSDESIFNVNY